MEEDILSDLREVMEASIKRSGEEVGKIGLPILDDKEALRRWKMSRSGKHYFFSKYHVSENFMESQKSMFHEMIWNDISLYQVLSYDFIVRNKEHINFSTLQHNPFVNHDELEEKGVYLLIRLI